MKPFIRYITVLLAFVHLTAMSMSDTDYLPQDTQYNSAIPTPTQVLGSPVGEWHVRHDQIVRYMQLLAEKSDRVSMVETGRSHENRPLYLLAFTSAENQKSLEQIRQAHIKAVTTGSKTDIDDPLVIWMGYSVHGDEASGSNAALLVAYYLAAGNSSKIDQLLNNNVVLLDPVLNPDGLSRFAQWVNMHKSKNLVADPQSREHVQAWPSGRTNHYWFDLNRDWLLLTHPESRARIKQYHDWRPHVLTDFHEMGSDSTYFFQPGIPSRRNPWTPAENARLTEELGKFHASALDQEKELYFTQEDFDDFYYGKGSTYPDAHGTIGILFEQASVRGHLRHTQNGTLHFSDAVQNQVTTSLSTFEGALANKQALLDYQREFKTSTEELVKDDDIRGYVVTEQQDPARFEQFKSIIAQHRIAFKGLRKEVKLDDRLFAPAQSIYVPLDQPQYRLIKSIFSTRKRFDDNTFYDVSNWNLALAFNLNYAPVNRSMWRNIPTMDIQNPAGKQGENHSLAENAYAYAFSWQHYYAPKLLQRLIKSGVQIRVAGAPFAAETTQGTISFPAGSVIVPKALKQPENLTALLQQNSADLDLKIWSVESGLSSQGVDLGSRKVEPVTLTQVLLVGGVGTSQYEAGEVWHYLDQHVDMPVSIVDKDRLASLDLTAYSHMIWVNGNYAEIDEAVNTKVETWVKNGGVLIGQKSATRWFSEQEWLKAKFVSRKEVRESFNTNNLTYGDKEALEGKQRIAGAVFQVALDVSHPLAFGYQDTLLPMFRNHTNVMMLPVKPFVTVGTYSDNALLAGYTSDELQELISGSAAIVAHRLGKGRVIGFTDNLNFRGYWYGTSRLLSNAIFMSGFIDGQG